MKNQNIFIYNNEQDSVPRASAGAGSISSANNNLIIGVGTAFLTEANIDDYIYIKAQNDFRKIEQIMSDTELIVSTSFGVALVGDSYHITPAPRYRMVSWLVTGANVAVIDGEDFTQNEGNTFEKHEKSKEASGDYVPPIDIDASVNNTTVKITVIN